MFHSRERLFKMLSAFSIDEIDEDFFDYRLFDKLDSLVKTLLKHDDGVKRKSEKKFLSTVHHDTFTGSEFLHSLKRILKIDNSAEAVHLGNLLLHYGYMYPCDGHSSTLAIKDDGTLFRFQNVKYWPTQKPDGSEEEYAVFLAKKKMLAKGKNGLNHDELAYFAKLLELFGTKWSSVISTADEQCRVLKEKKKTERLVIEKEEDAFWRVHRPREDEPNVFDVGQKRFLNRFSRKDLRTLSAVQTEVNSLKESSNVTRIPSSIAINNLITHCDSYMGVDILLDSKSEQATSSRWLKDFVPRTTSLDGLRLEKWKVSLKDLLSDSKGIEEFGIFLKKEFSEENLRFWLECEQLRYAQKSKIKSQVIRIYRDFMAPGARFEVNVDNKAMTEIREGVRNPSRYAFDAAQSQIYHLMNTDSYPRFIKSQEYKDLVERTMNAKLLNTRKSNNRLLEAARGLVKKPSLTDVFNSSTKEHPKLARSSSDFPGSQCRSVDTNSTSSSCWYLQVNSISDRSKSENDLTRLDEMSNPASPVPMRVPQRQLKLKGLPVLKLSRSVTPTGSPIGSPSKPPIYGFGFSPKSSPRSSRKIFDHSTENDKKPRPFRMSELEKKLTSVKQQRDLDQSDDLDNWHWEKVSHDFDD